MATKNIGGSITLEGASKYNSDLKAIKSNLTELRSEMKLANAENQESANTYTALAQKSEILGKQIEQTGKKLEIYNKLYDQAAESQKKAETQITTYSSKLAEAQKELDRMKASGTATDEELKNQEKIVSELSQKLESAQNGYNSASLKMNQYATAANNTKSELTTLTNSLAENDKYLDEAKNSADGTATSIDKFGKIAREAGENLEKTGQAVQMLASSEAFRAISEGAKKVTESLLECVEASTKWGAAMAKVQSIAQVSDGELSTMGEDIRHLSTEYGVGANEIAEATYQAISASVDAAQATRFVEDSIKLARGGFTDVTSAVDVMTTVTNAYGKEANSTAHIMDTLIQTQNLGKTTVNELAQSLGMVIPTAAAYSVNLDNIASSYIQLTKNGVNTANATTMINGLLTELADSGSQVSKILKEKTNKSFGELMKSGKNLGEVIQILGESVDGDSEAFANLWGNVRAGRGAVTLFNNGAQAFTDSMDAIATSAGAADKAFSTMADTAEMTDKRLEAATDNLKVAIGEALEPTLDELKQSGLEALEPLTQFVEENPILIQTIAGTVTAVAGVATAVTACAAAVAILKAAFGDLSGALAVLGTAAAIGGVVAYSNAIDKTSDQTMILIGETEKLSAELQKNEQARQQNREDMRGMAASAKELASELGNLQKKTTLSTDEAQRQKEIVGELNAIFPELNLAIDSQTGKLDEHSQAVLNDVDALTKEYMAQAAQKDLVAISEELYQAEKARSDLNKQRTEELMKLKEAEQLYIEQTKAGDDNALNTLEVIARQREEVEALDDAYIKAGETVSEQKDRFAEISAYVEETTAALGKNEEAEEALGEQYTETGGVIIERTKEQEDALFKFVKGVQDTVTTINPLFDELKTTMDESLTSITEHLQKNAEASAKFAEAITEATSNANYGVSTEYTDLVNSLAAKGPEATEILNQFAKGAADNSEEFQTAMKAMRESIEGEGSITVATGKLIDTVGTHFTTLSDTVTQGEEDITTAMEKGGEDQKTAVETTSKDIEELARDGVSNTAQAVTSTAPEVTTATQTAAEGAVKAAETALGMSGSSSSVFKKMGVSTMQSFAAGVTEEGSAVKDAIQKVLETAISTIDISGLSERIDKALGNALSG